VGVAVGPNEDEAPTNDTTLETGMEYTKDTPPVGVMVPEFTKLLFGSVNQMVTAPVAVKPFKVKVTLVAVLLLLEATMTNLPVVVLV
jgi:hypothetical protein